MRERPTKPGVASSNLASRTDLELVLSALWEEGWASVTRAPGYQASSDGRIRRAGHSVIKPRLTRKGYQIVDVVADGRPNRTVEVHCLVADAWIGPRPDGLTIDHLGPKPDNRPYRLEYVTNLENQRRRWARLGRSEQSAARAA